MRVNHLVRSMTVEGEIKEEDFANIDESLADFEKKKQSEKYRYIDLEVHTVIKLKSVF